MTENEETVTEEAYYVVGSHKDGSTVLLEKIDNDDDWDHRIAFWSDKPNSYPYHQDIHVTRKRTVVTYTRVVRA